MPSSSSLVNLRLFMLATQFAYKCSQHYAPSFQLQRFSHSFDIPQNAFKYAQLTRISVLKLLQDVQQILPAVIEVALQICSMNAINVCNNCLQLQSKLIYICLCVCTYICMENMMILLDVHDMYIKGIKRYFKEYQLTSRFL